MSQRRLRAAVRIAAGACSIGLCATVLSAAPAVATAASVTLTASCGFTTIPATPASTVVSAELPDTASTTEPVRINGFSVSIVVPEATVTALRAAGTTAIGANLTAALTATWQQEPHDLTVPVLTAPDTPLPDTGDLRITAAADVPPVAVAEAGEVTFAVPQVVSTLTLHNGETTEDVPCSEDPGQDGTIGAVAVAGNDTSTAPTSPATSSAEPTTSVAAGPTQPGGDGSTPAPNQPRAAADQPAPGDLGDEFDDICDPKAPGTIDAGLARYKIGGKVTVAKLHSDLTIPVGELRGEMFLHLANPAYACIDGNATTPDSAGYFTMFNFVPATGVVHIPPAHTRTKITMGFLTSLTKTPASLHDVEINGQPLPVGPNCHTTRDVVIKAAGPYQSFTSSGSVPGVLDLPTFAGCANGTDPSSPIFNGLVSGPDNPVVIDLTFICFSLSCNGKP